MKDEETNESLSSLKSDLVRKIRLQIGVHSFYESRTRKVATIHKTINIILSTMISLLAFSDVSLMSTYIDFLDPDLTRFTIGVFAFLLFLENVLVEVFFN
jgi:hypothetical protein